MPTPRTSHATLGNPRSPLKTSFTPAVISSSADMAGPLSIQFAYSVSYVYDFSRIFRIRKESKKIYSLVGNRISVCAASNGDVNSNGGICSTEDR